MKRNLFLICFGIFCFTFAVASVIQHQLKVHYVNNPIIAPIIKSKNPIEALHIRPLDNTEFEITLDGNKKIHAVLDVYRTTDSSKKIAYFLNHCKDPKVILNKKLGTSDGVDKWSVQIYVTTSDGLIEMDLATWLKKEGLVNND